ncbi:ATP synthase F1 subunit delta [Candidatus Acidulodesulfobacterium sp. H_13]|uniref:ATP synthase F1 subunit delta n=1 Tax=Candidatus Acidulodesulfobacterium sp. H_13 TaxID=3395470 RepID=UPI003AF7D1A9
MIDDQISKRYAGALFEFARHSDKIEEVYKDIDGFIDICYDNLCLKEFLSQTYIDKKERFEIVNLLAAELSLSAEFINFLHLLIENERMEYLPKIFIRFSDFRDDFMNILRVDVVSAKELDDNETNKIKRIIEKVSDKTVVITNRADKSIIAGYIINVENISYDGSIKAQISSFYNYLKQGAFIYGN